MDGKHPYPPPGGAYPPAAAYPPPPPAGYPQAPPPGYEAAPPGYSQAPPPYQSPAGATGTTVVVQQAPPKVVTQPQPKRGLFGSFMHEFDKIGKQVGKEVDYCAGKVNQTLEQSANTAVLNYFQTGNVVQLVSRASGKSLQIVMAGNGQLVVDGTGPTDHQHHTLWTVVNEGKNQVRLHNNNNYLTIVGGHTSLITMPPGALHGVETKFQLAPVGVTQFITFESMKEPRRHIGVLQNGQLKPALSTGREEHGQFGVRLVYTPYGQQVTTVKK